MRNLPARSSGCLLYTSRNMQLGRLSVYTAPISLLGNAYVDVDSADITDSSFTIGLSIDTDKTLEGLLTLMERLPVEITSDTKTWKNEEILLSLIHIWERIWYVSMWRSARRKNR